MEQSGSATPAVDDRLRELVTGKIVEYDQPVPTAAAAAAQLGCDVGAIANSLVFAVGDEPLLIIASGAHRVRLERVAELLGVPAVGRADKQFVLRATGQPVGGVAPIGHPRPIRTVVDVWLKRYDEVWAGAGTRHAMFSTTFDELVRLTNGLPADVGN